VAEPPFGVVTRLGHKILELRIACLDQCHLSRATPQLELRLARPRVGDALVLLDADEAMGVVARGERRHCCRAVLRNA
jgi:hypothetical protein